MKKPIISQEERQFNRYLEIELALLNFKRALDNNIKTLPFTDCIAIMLHILNHLSKLF